LALAVCAVATGGESRQPIHDEVLRLAALRTVFPGMEISVDRGSDKPGRAKRTSNDALAREKFIAS
jgi:hypothetical protein